MLTVRLPLPPSSNNAYANGRRGRVLTEAARSYKARVGWLTRVAMQEPGAWPVAPPYDVTLCYYAGVGRRPDPGNVEKLAVDAVFDALRSADPDADDRHIYALHILMRVDTANPRLDLVLRTAGEERP